MTAKTELIKKIDDSTEIRISDSIKDYESIVPIGMIVIGTLLILGGILLNVYSAPAVGIVVLVVSIFGSALGIWNMRVPVYIIYIDGFGSDQIPIIKTTPDEDIKAISKAVEKLTPVAIKIAREKRELKELVSQV
jgi:hypothetical protein